MSDLATLQFDSRPALTVARILGEIDLSNAVDLGEAIGTTAANDAVVVVDLSETGYIDSAGIAMLFRLDEYLKNKRQELRLVVPADAPVHAILRLTNVDRVIPCLESLD